MQLRFDGAFGFPGGLIDPGESIVDGLNRECGEEIGLDSKYFVTKDDLVFSAFTTTSPRWPRLEMHAFAKEVSAHDSQRIEQNVFNAKDFGEEVRCPRIVFLQIYMLNILFFRHWDLYEFHSTFKTKMAWGPESVACPSF